MFLTNETFVGRVFIMAQLPHFTLIDFPIEIFAGVVVPNHLGHSCLAGNHEDITCHGFKSTNPLTRNGLVDNFVISNEFTLLDHHNLILDFTSVHDKAF